MNAQTCGRTSPDQFLFLETFQREVKYERSDDGLDLLLDSGPDLSSDDTAPQPRKKPELNLVKKVAYEIGLDAKAPRERRVAGLIVMPQTAKVGTRLVVEQRAKKERNIPLVVRRRQRVDHAERVKNGAKSLRSLNR